MAHDAQLRFDEAPRPRRSRIGLALVSALVLLLAAGAGVWWLRQMTTTPFLPPEQCLAQTDAGSVWLSHEQATNAALISGIAIRDGLGTRAAAIALATAYQESGLRNLDYGDRDSLGLFQQRPSQGWGTPEQILDPYYSTETFYAALVKIPDWQNGDINDTAQAVQRSGVPDGYRKHEANALILADVFTGTAAAGLTCVDRFEAPANADDIAQAISTTWGVKATADTGELITLTGARPDVAWAWAHLAIARGRADGVVEVRVGDDHTWRPGTERMSVWERPTPAAQQSGTTSVTILLRPPEK